MKRQVSDLVVMALLVVLVIITIVLSLWYILGRSPLLEQVSIAMISTLYGIVFLIYRDQNDKVIDLHKSINDMQRSLGKIEGKLNERAQK